MIVSSTENSPKNSVVPVLRRFEDQEVEDRIVSGRYGAAQLHFGLACAISSSGYAMWLNPVGIWAPLLLRDASEVEVGTQTQILQETDLIEKRSDDTTSAIADCGFRHREVLHCDAKRNRRSAEEWGM